VANTGFDTGGFAAGGDRLDAVGYAERFANAFVIDL
jgi:hypothetical protein